MINLSAGDFLECYAFTTFSSGAGGIAYGKWGGYKLIPNYYEFWQGRPSRLHDRFIYENKLNKWNIHRLQP